MSNFRSIIQILVLFVGIKCVLGAVTRDTRENLNLIPDIIIGEPLPVSINLIF